MYSVPHRCQYRSLMKSDRKAEETRGNQTWKPNLDPTSHSKGSLAQGIFLSAALKPKVGERDFGRIRCKSRSGSNESKHIYTTGEKGRPAPVSSAVH